MGRAFRGVIPSLITPFLKKIRIPLGVAQNFGDGFRVEAFAFGLHGVVKSPGCLLIRKRSNQGKMHNGKRGMKQPCCQSKELTRLWIHR
jgi:hypothetical protein